MLRNLWMLVLGMVLLVGCGGQQEAPPAGFVNQTHHSDTELWTIWKAAQETLAQEIDLNPCSGRSPERRRIFGQEMHVRSKSSLTNSGWGQSRTSPPACCSPPRAWIGITRPA
jgi:hypothetical protein